MQLRVSVVGRAVSLLLLPFSVAFFGLSQEMTGEVVALKVATSPEQGAHLVDGSGSSLYVFVGSDGGTGGCNEDCGTNWSPMILVGDLVVGQGVNLNLLGALPGSGNGIHLTYSGFPLYRFATDQVPGEAELIAQDGSWLLITPSGEAVFADAAAGSNNEEQEYVSKLVADGQEVYLRTAVPQCSVCHGVNGEGVSAPRLTGSSIVANTGRLVRQVLNGGQFMPPFKDQLTDSQIAGVATYIRNAFGNDLGPVTVEEVAEQRR